jgi:multidrug resistance efflux pump
MMEAIERFFESTIWQEHLMEERAGELEARKKVCQELAELNAAEPRTLEALNTACKTQEANVVRLRQELRQAEISYSESLADRRRCSTNFDMQRSRLEATLRRTAPPEIDVFISEMRGWLDETRRQVQRAEDLPKSNYFTDPIRKTRAVYSNYTGVIARLNAIIAAIKKAEDLKLSATADTGEKLAQLRASIPEIGEMELA